MNVAVAVAVVAEWMTIEHSSVAVVVAVVFGWHTVGNEVSYDSYSYYELC